MSIQSRFQQALINWLLPEELFDYAERRRLESMARYHDYVEGFQRKTLTVKVGKPDDNIALNLVKTVVDDSVAMLFGQEIHGNNKPFEMKVDHEKDDEIQKVWKKNKQMILLFEIADFGTMYGTGYIKIIPNYWGGGLHRLVNLDPFLMRIKSNPDDIDDVQQYIMRYNTVELNSSGRKVETAKKEVTSVASIDENGRPLTWRVEYLKSNFASGGRWVRDGKPEDWEYPFPPILHFKNLIRAGSVYGRSDLSGNVIALQDRINYVASNTSKIIRNHGHPKTWAAGVTTNAEQKSWGMDDMVTFPDPDAKVDNLEMQSDLDASREFVKDLREVFYNITRTTDIAGLQEKIGYITNFALRVFYSDSLKKLSEKRMLYGDALQDLNRRLLVINGMEVNKAEGVDTLFSWPEPLPVDQKHQAETFETDQRMEVVSKATIAKERGYDWEEEQKERKKEAKEQEDLGTYLINKFSKDREFDDATNRNIAGKDGRGDEGRD